MAASYERAAANVKLILRKRYNLTVSEAENAVCCSPLRSVFEENPEMAAHTANETWAREVYKYWCREQGKQ